MLYIRTDMNAQIATGHIMRCLSIADAARALGERTTFLLADAQAVPLLEERGYGYIILGTKWKEMDDELPVIKRVMEECGITELLIDSYQVTQSYLAELSKCVKVIYLDDLNAFQYPVAELICYANYWEEFGYQERYENTRLHLGMQFVPLRPVYWNCEKKQVSKAVENILVLSGGSDPYNAITKILEGLDRTQFKRMNVICGIYNERYETLCERYKREENIFVYKGVSDIERYMKEADVAISAGGTTLYELCACGTPTISYSFADNQLNNVKKFHEDGLIPYVGDVRYTDIIPGMRECLKELNLNPMLRQKQSQRMQMLVDGKGAMRIARLLLAEQE